MNALEQIPNALLAELVRAGKKANKCITHPCTTINGQQRYVLFD